MAAREWLKLQEWRDGRVANVHKAVCGAEGCSVTAEIHNLNAGAKTSGEVITRKLRMKGWEIGHRPEDDRCPECVDAATAARRAAKAARATPVCVPEKPPAEDKPMKMSPTPTPGREPNREQRRRIMEALDDVYPKAEQGYSGNMSDELLAARLDVPRKWVTDLREQLYGPEFVVDVKSFRTRLALLEGQYRELENEMLEKLSVLSRQIDAAKREVDSIEARMGVRV